ncbi:hypothetical protein ZIOFF_034876 [Zingiber officinale]|uniref:Pentatricopeptide repeat-containing protein n=1 Tax=Zingiber officinale TaxID=94328 RepID=A0A8J5GAS5_ZINOF|nr:hypothetical protein ZIOFF_034876 [Zingiber officinale]
MNVLSLKAIVSSGSFPAMVLFSLPDGTGYSLPTCHNTLLPAFAVATGGAYACNVIHFFSRMRYLSSDANGFNLSSIISSVVNVIEQFHSLTIVSVLNSYVSINNSLINSYNEGDFLVEVKPVFDEMFYKRKGFEIDIFMLVNMLTTFMVMKDSTGGAQFHVHMSKNDFARKSHVDSGLIDMSSKVGWIVDAMKVFKEVDDPNLVVWNTMISSACSNLSSPSQGKQMHGLTIKTKSPSNQTFVDNALVSMYAKCGNLKDVSMLFEMMPQRNMVSFNTMTIAYAQHRLGLEALELFKVILDTENEPTSIIFILVLSAYVHTRKVDEGLEYFDSMRQKLTQYAYFFHITLDFFGGSVAV